MALNALSLSVSSGVQGRRFASAITGLTAGTVVEVIPGGAPGFGVSNAILSNEGLPYDSNLAIVRERVPTTGETRTTNFVISATGAYAIAQQAAGMASGPYRIAPVVQSDGSLLWKVFVQDGVGATTSANIGSTVVTLGTLTLSGSLQIGTAASGTIIGATAGSTIAGNIPGITINSGARTYSGTPTGSAATISNGLVEMLAGASNTPNSSPITVAAAAVTLGTLTLSGSLQIGTAASGTIIGATAGSTITGNIPGITVNSGARTYSGTPTGSAGAISNALVETLAGATNTPHNNSITVAAAGVAMRTLPALFTSTSLWPVKVVQAVGGVEGVWGTDYSSANFRHTGTTYYVATTGNDTTGDGSVGNPWATLQKAHDTAAASSQISVAAGRYDPVSVSKNMTFFAATDDTVYVGPFLKNSDVSSWGTLASGRQTITLTSGISIFGFVDLTQTYPANLRSYPKVAKYSADLTILASRVNENIPVPAILPGNGSTASVLAASDGRDLTNKFDTELLAWKYNNSAAGTAGLSPLYISGTAQVYSRGIFWCGGSQSYVGAASGSSARLVMEKGGFLGSGSNGSQIAPATDQCVLIYGTGLFVDGCAIGSCWPKNDTVDFNSGGAVGVTSGMVIGQSGEDTGDQGETSHGGPGAIGINRVNNIYFSNRRHVGDLPASVYCLVGCKAWAGNNGNTYEGFELITGATLVNEAHYANITFLNNNTDWTHSDFLVSTNTDGFFYDQPTYDRQKTVSGTGVAHNLAGTTAPTADAILAQIDLSQLGTLWKDTGRTLPVTTSGDTVALIDDPSTAGQYWTVGAGTITFQEAGSGLPRRLVPTSGGRLVLNGRTEPFGLCDVVAGVKTSNASLAMFSGPWASNLFYFGGAFTSANPPTQSVYCASTTPSYRVDNGTARTTKSLLQAALCNGVAHVLSVENIDLFAMTWARNLTVLGGNNSTTYSLTGDFYGLIVARKGTAGALDGYKATIATASGVTLP
jgi:hypothetical protein